ncbi:hypothetical protein ACEPAI_7397 [Sanghuangporus weigelae]
MYAARAAYIHKHKIIHVPESQYAHVSAMMRSKHETFEIGSWIEVCCGKFKGDLGIVEDVDDEKGVVHIIVRARIAQATISALSERPPQCLATMEWLKRMFPSESVQNRRDGTYKFRGGIYSDGFRILRLAREHIRRAFPVVHKILPFQEHGIGVLEDVEWYIREGDVVVVMNGPWSNLVGTVVERVAGGVVLSEVQPLPSLSDTHAQAGNSNEQEVQNPTVRPADIPRLRRQEVMLLLDCAAESGHKLGDIFVELKNIRRILDVGDEIRVKAGRYADRPGLIIAQQGDLLTVHFSRDELLVDISRFWVETVEAADVDFRPPRKEREPIQCGDLVIILAGPFKGRWQLVDSIHKEYAYLCLNYSEADQESLQEAKKFHLLSELEKEEGIIVSIIEGDFVMERKVMRKKKVLKMPLRFLFKATWLDAETKGLNVLICNRDKTDFNMRLSKGMYGFVRSVDMEWQTAQVDYQNKQAQIPLRNLVSCDRILSLDPMFPLSRLEAHKLYEQLREGTKVMFVAPKLASRTFQPAIAPEKRLTEPVTDFSRCGYWIFEPSINVLYTKFKVGVRVRSKDRAGYITGDLQEEHSGCMQVHDRCRVMVNLILGRTVTTTQVEVSDIDPCRPAKKNSTVLQIRGLNGGPARTLIATGVPRLR